MANTDSSVTSPPPTLKASERVWAIKHLRIQILSLLPQPRQLRILTLDRETFRIVAGFVWRKMDYKVYHDLWRNVGNKVCAPINGPLYRSEADGDDLSPRRAVLMSRSDSINTPHASRSST
jgi:hypothetical protein